MTHAGPTKQVEAAAVLAAAAGRLATAGVASPRVDAELLLAHVLGVPRARLLLVRAPTGAQRTRFDELVARRAAREPLQHLTGSTSFRHVRLAVGRGVFVPRPETELLAGWAVEALLAARAAGVPEPVAVDLGTGSGAIAAVLAAEVRPARVHAVELSADAHAFAEHNLSGTGVDLRLGDMAGEFADLDGLVDVVVANPPYIPLGAYDGVDEESRRHEPAPALWSGDDGLDAIRCVERVGRRLLRPGGRLGCEHADVQGESAPYVFSASGGWDRVRDHRDLSGRARYVTARRLGPPGGTMGP